MRNYGADSPPGYSIGDSSRADGFFPGRCPNARVRAGGAAGGAAEHLRRLRVLCCMGRLMTLLLVPLLLAGSWAAGATAAVATPAMPAMPVTPATAATAATQPTIDQKCQELAERWHDRFAAEHMTCIVSPPFVVAGDGGQRRLQGYVDHTILASAEALHEKFFDRARPNEPILILLFESAGSYNRLAKKWLGDQPTTPYGYFRRDNIMVMNVGTGTGTLVHELVHALIRPDFPDVPEWFNEGLGSLFEQCTLAHRDIRG